MKGLANVAAVMIGAGLVKLYGEYKYYAGKVDANKTAEIIIDIQKDYIDQLHELLAKLKKEES